MTTLSRTHIIATILGIIVGIGCVYLLATSIVDSRMNNLEVATIDELREQQSVLVAIAEATARNGADVTTEQIVKDCPLAERSQFDDLLSRLNNGLSQSELTTLEQLFGRCGSFYAERKAVMVARLAREIEMYTYLVHQLGLITNSDTAVKYQVAEWQRLSDMEQKQSVLFDELVRLQDQIISSLADGGSVDNGALDGILLQVQDVQDSLMVNKQQTTNVRAELISL